MADDERERARLVLNEQAKLRATLINTVAGGFVIVGAITPITSALTAGTGLSAAASLLAIVWLLLAASLHYAGVLTLETLR